MGRNADDFANFVEIHDVDFHNMAYSPQLLSDDRCVRDDRCLSLELNAKVAELFVHFPVMLEGMVDAADDDDVTYFSVRAGDEPLGRRGQRR